MTTSKIERPSVVTDEHMDYLDELRDSGEINMFGAGPYLRAEFGLNNAAASKIMSYWMASFGERHPEEERAST